MTILHFPVGKDVVENVNYTSKTLAVMTPYSKAKKIASTVADIFKASYVVDACAGIGGNVLGFGTHESIVNVIAYESDREVWTMLANNINTFNAKAIAYNHSFEIGEDLQLLDINDNDIISKTVVYFNPPSTSKSGIVVAGKTLEYWCTFLLGQGYRGVILCVPTDYKLIKKGCVVDDSDSAFRLVYCSKSSSILNDLVITLGGILDEGTEGDDVGGDVGGDGEVKGGGDDDNPSSTEKAITNIPGPSLVKGPKVILQTYLTPDFPRRRYMKEHFNPKAIHLGQRKLLISEIEFLTRIIKNTSGKEASPQSFNLLYIGAAPGQHIPILSGMFPEIKFILYDPAPFQIKNSKSIEIHQELFTDAIAEKYRQDKKLIFISDIRSAPRSNYQESNETDPEFEDEVRKNLAQQRKWVEDIRPLRSLLKFRLPFTDESDKASTDYFDGIVNFQAYAPPQSAETRLEVGNSPRIISYDHSRYEQQMFYFNTQYRIQGFQHYNQKYGWSYDTIREFFILKKYCALRGEGFNNIPKYFAKFDELTDKVEKKISRILEKY